MDFELSEDVWSRNDTLKFILHTQYTICIFFFEKIEECKITFKKMFFSFSKIYLSKY